MTQPPSAFPDAPIRVMIVEDSAVVRGLVNRALKEAGGIEVVASAFNGAMAIEQVVRTNPDIILLDIEMPEMDGITALPQLRALLPTARVIMVSTLTEHNARISLQALELGASDTIAKPTAGFEQRFYDELIAKIRALSPRKAAAMRMAAAQATLRYPSAPVKAIAIGASTGGPQALSTLFKDLCGHFPAVPMFITQHMPPTFTRLLAQHLSKLADVPCMEGADGEVAQGGSAYLAPGDYHMAPEAVADKVIIRINQNPPVHFCRPAVDPMLAALARIYGKNLLTVILTGMGSDGLAGAKAAAAAGGTVIAQDEASSVVWGMPRAVSEEKLASAILPIDALASYIRRACV